MATSDNRQSVRRLLLLSQILIIMAFSEKPNLKIAPPLSFSLISDAQTKTASFPASALHRSVPPSARVRRCFRLSQFITKWKSEKARVGSARADAAFLFACRLLRLFYIFHVLWRETGGNGDESTSPLSYLFAR